MLIRRHLFSIIIIFILIVSGCSPSNETPIATLSVATETPEPVPSSTAIPSATAEPTLTPIPTIEDNTNSLEAAQAVEPTVTALENGFGFDAEGGAVTMFENDEWKKIEFSDEDLTKMQWSSGTKTFVQGIVVAKRIDYGAFKKGAIKKIEL